MAVYIWQGCLFTSHLAYQQQCIGSSACCTSMQHWNDTFIIIIIREPFPWTTQHKAFLKCPLLRKPPNPHTQNCQNNHLNCNICDSSSWTEPVIPPCGTYKSFLVLTPNNLNMCERTPPCFCVALLVGSETGQLLHILSVSLACWGLWWVRVTFSRWWQCYSYRVWGELLLIPLQGPNKYSCQELWPKSVWHHHSFQLHHASSYHIWWWFFRGWMPPLGEGWWC